MLRCSHGCANLLLIDAHDFETRQAARHSWLAHNHSSSSKDAVAASCCTAFFAAASRVKPGESNLRPTTVHMPDFERDTWSRRRWILDQVAHSNFRTLTLTEGDAMLCWRAWHSVSQALAGYSEMSIVLGSANNAHLGSDVQGQSCQLPHVCSIHNRSRQLYFDQHMLMFTRHALLTVLAFMHNTSIPVQLGYNASAGDAGPLLMHVLKSLVFGISTRICHDPPPMVTPQAGWALCDLSTIGCNQRRASPNPGCEAYSCGKAFYKHPVVKERMRAEWALVSNTDLAGAETVEERSRWIDNMACYGLRF